ncbi:MAG: glycosyltransferase family 4 protein [Verrucomicrobiae bacterium]|nr:glycosyltransferase family 4 protein [Verrucomicrobiae bacterium]NNJ43716.1 glycosyltransferase family 4 protein [Akkermansiaceae bacterium]
MKLAIFLQHYFPYGGLQRDAVRLAIAAQAAGEQPTLIVAKWDGEKPKNIPIVELNSGGRSNHRKAARFADACQPFLSSEKFDSAIAFSRVPNAPFHFCGDSCFLEGFQANKPTLTRFLPRYRYFLTNEKLVFGPDARTHIFFLAEPDSQSYQQHYQLGDDRFSLLPPWLKQADSLDTSEGETRKKIHTELRLSEEDQLLLFVGSNFKLKRVAKIIETLPFLDDHIHLAVCGKDDPAPLEKLANLLGVAHRVHIMGPRDNIPAWMTAADLLVHPSSRETAGMVLVEALTYGLPVTCTRACGYANHVADAGGHLLSNDCPPEEIAQTINGMLAKLPSLQQKALTWAANPDHYRTADVILDRIRASID